MKIDAFAPAYPQSIARDVNGDLRCTDEPGYGGRMGMDIITVAALEFAKVHLAELIDHKRGCAEPMPEIHAEAARKGWEAAVKFVAARRVLSEPSNIPD